MAREDQAPGSTRVRVWLGSDPVQTDIKDGMLGK